MLDHLAQAAQTARDFGRGFKFLYAEKVSVRKLPQALRLGGTIRRALREMQNLLREQRRRDEHAQRR